MRGSGFVEVTGIVQFMAKLAFFFPAFFTTPGMYLGRIDRSEVYR
jgi:hypothetical protein